IIPGGKRQTVRYQGRRVEVRPFGGPRGGGEKGPKSPDPKAKTGGDQTPAGKGLIVPDLRELVALPQSEMQGVVQRYEIDRASLNRFYTIPGSPTRHARLRRFPAGWLAALQKLDPAKLGRQGREDFVALQKRINGELRELDRQAREWAEIAPLLPFAPAIIHLEEARQRMETIDAAKAAGLLSTLKKQIDRTRRAVEAGAKADAKAAGIRAGKDQARRAARAVGSLRTTLTKWFNFYNLYDPLFTWWMAEPYKDLDRALESYAGFLREQPGGGPTGGAKAGRDPKPTKEK